MLIFDHKGLLVLYSYLIFSIMSSILVPKLQIFVTSYRESYVLFQFSVSFLQALCIFLVLYLVLYIINLNYFMKFIKIRRVERNHDIYFISDCNIIY